MNRAIAVTLLLLLATSAAAQTAGPQGSESGSRREQEWRIPAEGGGPLMAARVMRPAGEARAPLVVINHGSPADSSERPKMAVPRYPALSSYFLARGYVVVLPLRRGYGATGGAWAEAYGSCGGADYYGAGLRTASDIKATIDYMRRQPFVAPDRAIVVGHSAGGWGAIALSSLNPPGVAGLINFAGGRGGHQTGRDAINGNCSPDALVRGAARYGATAREPTLWIYADNDSFFSPALARRMVDAYTGAGGLAIYKPQGSFARDGHTLASSDSGASVWQPLATDFLAGK